MLRKILKPIRKQLLKSDRFKNALAGYRLRLKIQRHRERWAKLLLSGYTARNVIPEKLDPYDTLVIVTDDGVYTEHMNGRVVDRWVPAQGQGESYAAEKQKDFRTYDCNGRFSAGDGITEDHRDKAGTDEADAHTGVGPCTQEPR